MQLQVRITEEAQQQVLHAREWLGNLSPEYEERFCKVLEQELLQLTERVGQMLEEGAFPQYHEEASLAFSRRVHQYRFRTGKRRQKRSSSGIWNLFYMLLDLDGDRVFDTIRIISVRHAASAPLWDTEQTEGE
nr:hypothetical protein [Armatimonas sp.]